MIFNIALHGMEAAAGVAYRWDPHRQSEATVTGTPVLVRYADDFVALCDSREQAEQVKTRLGPWLAARGLAVNEDKTRVVHLDDGFDFLGFNVRRYGKKLLIKPSKAAVKRVRARLAAEMRALRGANASAVIATINPIVRGWAAYYRSAVSTETFQALDNYLWKLTYKWALYRHNHRSRRRIVSRYFGPLGVRRPGLRRLPHPVRLDEDRPTRPREGPGVPGRPGPDRVLGPSPPQDPRRRHTADRLPPDPAAEAAERTMPDLWRPAAARRPPTAQPRRM